MTEDMNSVIAEALADVSGGVTQTSDKQIASVSSLAQKQLELESKVDRLAKELEQAQKDLKKVAEQDLPNALIEMGSRGFTLDDGSKISVKKIYTANIKADLKPQAFRWMRDTGNEALIKAEVNVAFDKGDVEQAERMMVAIKKALEKKGLDVPVELSQSVHWQTLRAFVREQIEAEELALNEGRAVPEAERLPRDLLGVYIIDKAEITPPTKKK